MGIYFDFKHSEQGALIPAQFSRKQYGLGVRETKIPGGGGGGGRVLIALQTHPCLPGIFVEQRDRNIVLIFLQCYDPKQWLHKALIDRWNWALCYP